MEHFYNNVDSENWMGCEGLYSRVVKKFNSGSKFVEVGTWKGKSACYMAVEIINSGKDISFDCVDTWAFIEDQKNCIPEQLFNNLFETFLKNIAPVKDKINIVKSISWDGANLYENESLDFVYIDAGHDYESIKKDINAWYPKVKKGGIISGHDYVDHSTCGVKRAVNEFFKDKHPIIEDNHNWVVEKL